MIASSDLEFVPHDMNFPELTKLVTESCHWDGEDILESFQITPDIVSVVSGGLTNRLYCIHVPTSIGERKVLCRIFGDGTDSFINRDTERRVLCLLNSKLNYVNVHAFFKNGYLSDFIEGTVLSPQDFKRKDIVSMVGMAIGNWFGMFAGQDIGSEYEYTDPMANVCRYLTILKKHEDYEKNIQSSSNKCLPQLTELECVVDDVRQIVLCIESPCVVVHGDLLPGNIILMDDKVHFIDYEYVHRAARGFELGNHFREWCGFYPSDPGLFPVSVDAKRNVIEPLLEKWRSNMDLPQNVEIDTVEHVAVEADVYGLVALLEWMTWAMVQSQLSTLEYQNYVPYAVQQWEVFKDEKNRIMSLYAPFFTSILTEQID